MALDITGKLIKILPAQTGSGARGSWTKQDFVIETMEQYPKKVCCSAWGDKVENLKRFQLNDEIKVSFNIESREYNERWYTDIRAWKIESAGKKAEGSETRNVPPPTDDNFTFSSNEEDNLPF